MAAVVVGIDVSKEQLDVHLRPQGESFAVARDSEGLPGTLGHSAEGFLPPLSLLMPAFALDHAPQPLTRPLHS